MNSEPEVGPKPAEGFSGNRDFENSFYIYDENGRIKSVIRNTSPAFDKTSGASLTNPSARIGDYVIQNGQPVAVPNSPTYLAQQYQLAIGGTEAPESGFNLKKEGLAVAGPIATGAFIGGPVGAVVGGLVGAVAGLATYNTAREDALKRWQEQNVKYDSAVEFFRDDDGNLKYRLNYQKMGTGGPRSGEGVKEAQTRETQVSLGDDGHLKIQVSPIFAGTSYFKDMVKDISQNYGGLSKDTENLNQILDEIKNSIDGESKSFVSNMMLYADYANRFPEASPETVIASYTTEAAGYVAPDEMANIQVSVLDGKEVSTKTAQEFFDSVLGMSKKGRNELIKGLVEIISGDAEGYTDDQRAVAYGEYQSLFAASANTEKYDDDKYQGMLDADKIVSFINDFDPLGVDVSDALALISGGAYSNQEYLTQDEGMGFLGGLAGIAASFGLWKGGTKLIGGLLKRVPGAAQLFKNSISGQGRLALRSAIAKGEMGAAAKMWGADVAFNAIKIGTFDAALAGIQSGVSGTDFWSEFGQDFARDVALEALFSYYDLVQYQKYVTDDNVWLYANKDTGKLERSNVDKGMTYSGYEITDDGLVTSVEYEQVAKVNVGPDLQGNLVGVVKTPQGGTLEIINGAGTYTPPEGNVVEGVVETAPTEEMAGLMSGVIVESPANDVSTVMQALVKDGMSTGVDGVLLPSQAADSAIAAGKVAKVMGTKAGLQTYKQLFNKNAVLDYANNLALAKTGDQNAWRAAQEKFVSVTNNAESELNSIQNGVYIKEAAKEWEKTIEVIGGFNYQYKYKPKVDGAYINAINQLQRAQLLNDTRPEGDTTDYVAKALEKYGDAISKMPQDRAEALQKWLEQGKKWLKVFNKSVKKSGKVDLKKLESFTDTDIEEKIGYFPVWAKRTTYKGLLDRFYGISQTRNPYKEWLRNGEWVPLEELEDPYMAMTRYMNFMANNMGLNDMQEAAAAVYDAAGLLVDNTPTTATVRKKKLESIKNKDELTKKLDEMVEAKKKEVEAKTLTPKQYADAMTKLYEDSSIEEIAESLDNLGKDIVADKNIENVYPYGLFPDYSIKPKKGYGILYTNTPNDKVDIIKKEGLKIGQNLEAYGPSPDEGMYIWTDSRNPKESSYGGNTVAFQVPLDEIKQGTVNNTQVIIPHDIPREDILFIDKIYNYDPVVKASNLKRYVDKYGVEKTLEVLGRNSWVDIDEVKAILTAQDKNSQQWDDFWKSAPAQTRKDIRNELEKTSLQTGYGISDTRARLNAQMPGVDVLDWSLLSREQTNGLAPGGLYADKENPVKVYAMSVDDLAKLTGYGLDNANPDAAKEIEKHINTEGGIPVLPAHIRGGGDGPEVWLKMRWGHNSDSGWHWGRYLKSLKERGIEKVPVAIDDARGSDFNSVFYQVRNSGIAQKGMDNMVAEIDRVIASGEKPNFDVRDISAALHLSGMSRDRLRKRIRKSIPSSAEEGISYITNGELEDLLDEAAVYDWANDVELNSLADNIENVVKTKIGYVPQDITADVQQAFSEYGRIPWYHNQHKPLGSAEFNTEPPTGELAYTAQGGVGDAMWIAPNASYTNTGEYGKNQTVGTIPVKYFMSDKEMRELSDSLAKELKGLRDRAAEKGLAELKKEDNKILKNVKRETLHTQKDSIDDAMAQFNLHEAGWSSDLEKRHGAANYYVDNLGILYKGEHHFIDGNSVKGLPAFDFTFTPLNEIYHSPKEEAQAIEEGSRLLPKKDKARYDELSKIVEPYIDEAKSSGIVSYRALAEYAGKPVIDTTADMNRRGISGTAFFYYKGVSPEFDKEIGEQLAAQALFDRQHPQWTEDAIANAMEEYDGMSLDEMIDTVTMGEGFGEGWDDLFEQFNAGEISSSELSEEVSKFFKGVEKRYPGVGKVMQETWDNNTIQDLRDMKFRYWHPSTGYETIDDATAAQFLEEMGERVPGTPEEEVADGQLNFYDAIRATAENIPNSPQFKQPRIPTYEDYQKGLRADPSMAGRIQNSYRALLAQRLMREVTRVVGLAEDYLSPYSIGMDWRSNLNTSIIPDLQEAINQKMLPGEFQSFVQARMAQAIQDVAPYQSPELVLKSQLENVAQEWRDWATKHIKAGRFTQKDLKEFVGSHNIDLPNDKRPYQSKVKHALWQMVQDGKRLPEIEGVPTTVSKDMAKEDFYKILDETPLFQSAVKDKEELIDLVAAEKNQDTTDGYTMGVAATAVGLGRRTPLTWYKNGKPYTRFLKTETKEQKMVADETLALFNDKELVKEEGLISRFVSGSANLFRLFTTGWDPARVFPNLTRDTTRSFTIGERFINAKNTLQLAIEQGNYSDNQKEILGQAIENAANSALSSTYNTAYRTPRANQTSITKEYLSQNGASPMKRFMYNLVHDKRSIAEFPMEFFEGYSRRNNARSLAAVQLGKDQAAGVSFETQVKNAVDAATFAGREYTANFQRKGKLIGAVSKYVAYQSSAYAGLDGMLRAFIDNPKLVARNFAVFVLAYLILLADTLSREKTRNQYYRLSEYDRENQIVISMGDSILTIPMDQELAGLLFPYRRIMETLNGTDPVSFFELVWGTFTEWMPMDLSGFSEGDSFNLSRGLEKLTAQNMPTGLTPIQEAATGYDLYYGSDLSVTDEELLNYGIYSPKPGDYTTTGKDSLFLRNVANKTNIPQWQLQTMWEGYGGNIGKYVLNIIDKAAGATKEQQGGKDFADTVFNSFTALDQDNAANVFYDGLKQLGKEKNALIQKIAGYNEDLKVATGSAKVNLQNKIYEAKKEYAIKVGDFVDKYVSAYDITGGLPKKQAQQIYYLFRLDNDRTLYESGSPEEYYNNQAKQKFKNQATALSAPILDKYYNNRIGNIYQDADGVWRRYLSGGAQAMRNSIYGHGEQQMVDLLNILESKDSGLVNLRSKVKKARSDAYKAGDWDTRDALGYEFDKKVIEAISPYIEQYGAENVLGNTQVLDYLSDWFFVPNDFKKTKRGGYVSLANNAQTDEAFVRPYIKYVFGLPTNYSSYKDTNYKSLELGE